MGLYRLLYTSFISADYDGTEVPNIIRQARRNNGSFDITGLLIFDGLCFCQYLEGPGQPLEALLAKLQADIRHFEIAVKEHSPLPSARMFAHSALASSICDDPDVLDALSKIDPHNGIAALTLLEQLLPSLTIDRGARP